MITGSMPPEIAGELVQNRGNAKISYYVAHSAVRNQCKRAVAQSG